MAAEPSEDSLRLPLLPIAGVLGALAVVAGAFGAHALGDHLSPRLMAVWETAVRYHMWHSLALLLIATSTPLRASRPARAAGLCWIAGIVIFSGSLYALSLTGIGILGAITPLGGLALIAGWLLLGWAGVSRGHGR